MVVRRTMVWLISAGFGAACLFGVLAFFDTNLDRFALSNALLVFLSMGALAFIWLDFILRTNYLRT